MTFTAPPYLADPDPTDAPPVQFTIRTRYGVERHRAHDEHRAGPTCPCGPDIDWSTT